MYNSVQACAMGHSVVTVFFFFLVFSGPETRLCCKTCTFFSAHKRTGNEIIGQAKQGISPGPTEIELFSLFADDIPWSYGNWTVYFTVCWWLISWFYGNWTVYCLLMTYPLVLRKLNCLLCADDLTLLACNVTGLQNRLNALSGALKRWGLTVNFEQSKVMVFRKGGFLAARERWSWDDQKLEVANTYKNFGLIFLILDIALRQQQKPWQPEQKRYNRKFESRSISPAIFFKRFGAHIVPTLLYAAEMRGYKKYVHIERVYILLVRGFCMFVRRLQMILSTGNWSLSTVYTSCNQIG